MHAMADGQLPHIISNVSNVYVPCNMSGSEDSKKWGRLEDDITGFHAGIR